MMASVPRRRCMSSPHDIAAVMLPAPPSRSVVRITSRSSGTSLTIETSTPSSGRLSKNAMPIVIATRTPLRTWSMG